MLTWFTFGWILRDITGVGGQDVDWLIIKNRELMQDNIRYQLLIQELQKERDELITELELHDS